MVNTSGTPVDKLSACPLCQSDELSSVAAPPIGIGQEVFSPAAAHLGLSRCAGCSLVFVNPRPASHLLSEFYDRDGYECHNPHITAHGAESDLRARFAALSPYINRKGLLLDFGAGAGHLLRYARSQGWARVAGVEVGKGARKALSEEGFEMHADLASAHELSGQVDAVTMIHVLEHLTAPHEVLHGIGRLLRPDGVFLVEVPNADSLRARLALSFLKPLWTTNVERYLAFPIHLLYFNQHSLRILLEQAGFRVLRLATIGMGVEELRSSPATPPPQCPAPLSSANQASPSQVGAKSAAKQVVKEMMSTLRLGEQLLVVCQKA